MSREAASRLRRLALTSVLAAALALPRDARALPLVDEAALTLEFHRKPDFRVALAASSRPGADPSLDFDLLGAPPPRAPPGDEAVLKRRRSMLGLHQGLGLGLLGLQLATTVVGQLDYLDKYGANAPVTARYQATHKYLAYSTLGAFAVTGTVALFAPRDARKKSAGFDRVTLHKLGMGAAVLGMVTQGVLGTYTHTREGYLDQEKYARAHLAIGYATLAAVGVAVGALVF